MQNMAIYFTYTCNVFYEFAHVGMKWIDVLESVVLCYGDMKVDISYSHVFPS
jgi:hypothetical protein